MLGTGLYFSCGLLSGTVNLTVRYYASAEGEGPVGEALQIANVTLQDGLFEVPLDLSPANADLIPGDGSSARYIEIATDERVYPRQRFAPVPFALRVPIDGTSLSYDVDGKRSVRCTAPMPYPSPHPVD